VKSVGYVYLSLLSVLSRIFLSGVCGIYAALANSAVTHNPEVTAKENITAETNKSTMRKRCNNAEEL
jgi:hypothetical protein